MLDVNWLFLNAPHNLTRKYAICFASLMKSCHSNKKTLFGNSHVADAVITLDVTW